MHIIKARNVNDAFAAGLSLLWTEGELQDSRAGPVRVCPFPVTTVYSHPWERVLFDPVRDANPFFHLFESIWMLSGARDARWLDQFVSDFSSRFAEEGGYQHGAYGFRWRYHFDAEGGGESLRLPDQLNTIITMLKNNPLERRAVLTMWDPVADLGVDKRDIPCNTHVYFRVRGAWDDPGFTYRKLLDITVCCRSNDAIWGAYGANAVHFSVLQEYVAHALGVGMGVYYQVSNNFHAYMNVLNKYERVTLTQPYGAERAVTRLTLCTHECFLEDAERFVAGFAHPSLFFNPFFNNFAWPLLEAYRLWKGKERRAALDAVNALPNCDWKVATMQWMMRRITATGFDPISLEAKQTMEKAK
jgi:thymidylate synthase